IPRPFWTCKWILTGCRRGTPRWTNDGPSRSWSAPRACALRMAKPDFRPAFGAHPVPQLLDDLGEFAADIKGYFSGRFKLAPGDAVAWLGGDAVKAREFAVFGHDPDGSLYAYWLYG